MPPHGKILATDSVWQHLQAHTTQVVLAIGVWSCSIYACSYVSPCAWKTKSLLHKFCFRLFFQDQMRALDMIQRDPELSTLTLIQAPLVDVEIRGVPALRFMGDIVWKWYRQIHIYNQINDQSFPLYHFCLFYLYEH